MSKKKEKSKALDDKANSKNDKKNNTDLSQEDDKQKNNLIDNNSKLQKKSKEESLSEELELLREEKLRLLAEMENLRKRFDREKIDSIRYGSINLARDILSPDDNLSRALDAIPKEEQNSKTIINLIDGLKMVQKEFSTILERHGIKKIDALNKKFDHNFHQAMVEIEDNQIEEGTVIQEMQSGYTMHDRLLRPAMVGVSKKSKKNPDTQKNE